MRPEVMEKLKQAYRKLIDVSATETRRWLAHTVPEANDYELDQALYNAGHCSNGRG